MTGGIDVNRLTGFLLTHPVWDVTINTVYINKSKNQISTHTSRVGCDRVIARHLRNMFLFLLTHPVWDVTKLFI